MATETKLKAVENTENTENQKPTYEQLENACKELANKCNQLGAQLQKAEAYIATVNRLGILIKVVENAKAYSGEFINQCTKEIEEILTIKVEEKEGE